MSSSAGDLKRVAVIGSGVSGLGAAWLLNQDAASVSLFERQSKCGGHSNTVDYPVATESKDTAVPVDTGFIVFNDWTYPNLLAFLKELDCPHQPSDMSFSVSRDRGLFEWAGESVDSLFAQRKHLFSIGFWWTLVDILRFNQVATRLLALPAEDPERRLSIGAYLDRHGYGTGFARDYLIPMTAAIWSTPPDQCWRDFPAETLIRFMHNHGLLQVLNRPQWRTITGGRYVGVYSRCIFMWILTEL